MKVADVTSELAAGHINHALAQMSARVREIYSKQIEDFSIKLAVSDARETVARAAISRHAQCRTEFRDHLSRTIKRSLPRDIELVIRHESAKGGQLADYVDEKNDFYARDNPYDAAIGKEVFSFCVAMILLRSGFYEQRGRAHASKISSHVAHEGLMAIRWSDCGFGSVIADPQHHLNERDISACYMRLLHCLAKDGMPFADLEVFVGNTFDPLRFVSEYAYDMLVIGDAKTFLQEYMQSISGGPPAYIIESVPDRPHHDPLFMASVRVPGLGFVAAEGRSKKEATMLAAENAIELLRSRRVERFLAYEQLASVNLFDRKLRRTAQWYPDPGLLDRVDRWRKDTNIPFDLTSFDLIKCFSSPANISQLGGSGYGNGLHAQIGSHILQYVCLSTPIQMQEWQKMKLYMEHLRERYRIKSAESAIFGKEQTYSDQQRSDIVQALAFAAFSVHASKTLEELFYECEKALRPFEAATARQMNARHLIDRGNLDKYDANIIYTQILQEYTQSLPEKGVPKYDQILDKMTHHAPTHKSICKFSSRTTWGTGSTIKSAKNMAAFAMLKSIRSESK